MGDVIISHKNEKVKNLEKLQKPRERRAQNSIIIEGEREIESALGAGLKIKDFFYCPQLIKNQKLLEKLQISLKSSQEVSPEIFKKLTYKENPDGFLAVAEPKFFSLKDLKLPKNPLILVLEAVEKPGNLGGILRTAYAAGVTAVIINDSQTDIYNPNVIRASMGYIFIVPTIVSTIKETAEFLKKNKINICGTAIRGGGNYTKINYKKPTAIVLGTENSGLSQNWIKKLDDKITIPMKSGIDSLNVSVSAAILIYEIGRQRNFVDF
jgi:TrmH family RNA methyltransferase